MKPSPLGRFNGVLLLLVGLLIGLSFSTGVLEKLNQHWSEALHLQIHAEAHVNQSNYSLRQNYEPWLVYIGALLLSLFNPSKAYYRPFIFVLLAVFVLFVIDTAGSLVGWHNYSLVGDSMLLLILGLVFSAIHAFRCLLSPKPDKFKKPSKDSLMQALQEGELLTVWKALQHTEANEEGLELAYHLGCELEKRQLHSIAYDVFQRAARFDPGMNDLAARQQELQRELKYSEITRPLVGHYCLTKKIATGANSEVYEAVDQLLNKRVALKLIKAPDQEDALLADLYLQEIELAQSLDHPSIVRIHDAGQDQDRRYIVMNMLPGKSLDLWLSSGYRFADSELLLIAEQALQALGYAHSHQVIHADIKPANLIYDALQQQLYLTDFGAAQRKQKELRTKKRIIGTPAYMAPEQLLGREVDSRSDLYALGISLYQLSTGRLAYQAHDLAELKQRVLEQEIDWGLLQGHQPCLIELIRKSVMTKPYERFVDAAQMLEAVRHCRHQLTA